MQGYNTSIKCSNLHVVKLMIQWTGLLETLSDNLK